MRRCWLVLMALVWMALLARSARADSALTQRVYLPLVTRPRPRVEIAFEFNLTLRPGSDPRDLAVAFFTLSFVDANADPLSTLAFGTPAANALQGEGWWGNETHPSEGPFQWAGGAERRATLRVQPPPGAVGLLLRLRAVDEQMWMQVRRDGNLVMALPVATRPHQAYVPLSAPIAAPTPAAEPQWTAGRYFPSFPAAQRVYAFPLDTALKQWHGAPSRLDWRIDASPTTMMGLTLVGMQGVINRRGAEVYLDWDDGSVDGPPSAYWLQRLGQNVAVTYLDLDPWSAVAFLWQRYGQRFAGAVVYDPQVADTINLATMYAGLEDRLILGPPQLVQPGLPAPESLVDLRPLAASERWDNTAEGVYRLYGWVYRNLWPRLDRRVIGVDSPGPPTSGKISSGDETLYPLGLASRDHLIALRAAVLWLSPTAEPQASLFARFVDEAQSPAVVYGFYCNQEDGTVALASRHGGWCPVLTNGNAPLASGNLTALGAVRPALLRQPVAIDPQRLLDTLDGKPVLTLFASDGDSLQVQLDRGFHGVSDLFWDNLQGHRLGWTQNPTLLDLAPLVWNDYVQTQREVSQICGYSGLGYMYPTLMSDAQLRLYLQRAAPYWAASGLRVAHLDARFSPLPALSTVQVQLYYQELRDSGYLGVFVGDSGWPWGVGFHYQGTPAPQVQPSYVLCDHNADGIVADILARQPGVYRVELTRPAYWREQREDTYGWQRGQVVTDTAAHLGRALHFPGPGEPPGTVLWGPFAELAPGTYDVVYRLKVSDNGSTLPLARLWVTGNDPDGRTFVQHTLSPSDWSRGGQYEALTVTFTLERSAFNCEFRLDYDGGTAGHASSELWADEVVATRRGGLDLPVLAAAFAVPGFHRELDRWGIVQRFEAAGGRVLTPNEFIALLNPEYMIDFAARRLGANHSSLVTARAHLAAGRYLEALLAVRAGLRGAL